LIKLYNSDKLNIKTNIEEEKIN